MLYSSKSYVEPGVARDLSFSQDCQGARADELDVICHELRNSLAVVRGAARLLRPPTTNDRICNASSLIERHVGQIGRHIEDLLDSLRRGADNQGLQLSRIDLRVVARYATDAASPAMTRHRHHLVVNLPGEPTWIQGDGTRLEQVFSNLLINAAKYTPEYGEVSFTVERLAEGIFVRVKDSGVGIAPAMLSRVFDLFVQVDAEKSRAEGGRGIGLAVVREMVEKHGGTVRAESAGLGLGSEFIVELPVWRPRPDSSY